MHLLIIYSCIHLFIHHHLFIHPSTLYPPVSQATIDAFIISFTHPSIFQQFLYSSILQLFSFPIDLPVHLPIHPPLHLTNIYAAFNSCLSSPFPHIYGKVRFIYFIQLTVGTNYQLKLFFSRPHRNKVKPDLPVLVLSKTPIKHCGSKESQASWVCFSSLRSFAVHI